MNNLWLDLRYAIRQLRKSPGFALTAVITLALGIGANTAIFTLVHGILLRSLPVADPAQLYRIGDADQFHRRRGRLVGPQIERPRAGSLHRAPREKAHCVRHDPIHLLLSSNRSGPRWPFGTAGRWK